MNKRVLTLAGLLAAGLWTGCSDHVSDFEKEYENRKASRKIIDMVMKDSRDGNEYKVAVMGRLVWMAENLRYADSSRTKSLVGNSWCYDDKGDNCKKYGRLYSWTAAMNVDSTYLTRDYSYYSSEVQGVCPSGWRLPTSKEWSSLVDYVDIHNGIESVGASLKSTKGWTEHDSAAVGVDRFGFNALAAGRHNNDGGYMEDGKFAFFWSSTVKDKGTSVGWGLRYDNDFFIDGNYYKNHGLSVRCVTDTSAVTFDTTSAFEPHKALAVDFGYDSVKYEGRYYNTIKINDLVWFAENMAADKGDNWCYSGKDDNCEKYGRLYNWKTAMEVCPEGWRLPSSDDFYMLYNYVGGANVLRTADDWLDDDGDNRFGFSALPAGGYDGDGYYDLHSSAYFWSSRESETQKDVAYSLYLNYYGNSGVGHEDRKTNGLSVRCVKDAE